MLENSRHHLQESVFDPTGTNSWETMFLDSPLLIWTAAIFLAALPLTAAIFMPLQLQYENPKKPSLPPSPTASQTKVDLRKSTYFPLLHIPTKDLRKPSSHFEDRLDKPKIIFQKLCIFPIRLMCFKLLKVPRRLFAFFVDAFYIPQYRTEWGKYKIWSFRAQDRRPRPFLIKEEMKRLKLEQRRKSLEFHEQFRAYGGDYFIPRPVAHNHLDCAKVRISVNGCLFVTQERTLMAYPNSLLGNPSKRLQFYDPNSDALFFDRNRSSFEAILHFFQSGGQFRRPENVHLDVFLDDAEFYGIPQSVIEAFKKEEGLEKEEYLERVPVNLYKRKLWLLFDNPLSSLPARILAGFSVVVVIISILSFISETHVAFRTDQIQTSIVGGQVVSVDTDQYDLADPFFFTETVCVAWFTLEVVVRFICCPSKVAFLSSILNLIDIIAILPYYITLFTLRAFGNFESIQGRGGSGTLVLFQMISVLRLVRVLRVFKLSRHSEGLKILGRTLRASISELLLLVFFILIGIIIFSSAMHLVEGNANEDFSSIPGGFWWALITMTTVGYGDDFPRTWVGKCVGSLCAIAGVFTIALPVPVIVSNFNFFYHQAIDEAQFKLARINHVEDCPFRPGGRGKNLHSSIGDTDPKGNNYSEPDSEDDFEYIKFESRNRKQRFLR